MSAGVFILTKYEADNGDIRPIRVQPETLAANLGSVNAAPAGTADTVGFARVGGGRRRYGIKARTVRIKFTGALPDGYAPNQILTVPVLTKTVYDAIIAGTTTGTYLGNAIIVVGKSSEAGR